MSRRCGKHSVRAPFHTGNKNVCSVCGRRGGCEFWTNPESERLGRRAGRAIRIERLNREVECASRGRGAADYAASAGRVDGQRWAHSCGKCSGAYRARGDREGTAHERRRNGIVRRAACQHAGYGHFGIRPAGDSVRHRRALEAEQTATAARLQSAGDSAAADAASCKQDRTARRRDKAGAHSIPPGACF